ncbi:MAG: type I 3-dehydroquinate dehydratase [Candidatus Lokiarchaeota archaeon]|nr:type I 3-dehydroquinate dehydratase [Candidatus Lokiarchaeota archaeon]
MKKLPIAVALPVTDLYVSSGAFAADVKKVGDGPAIYIELRLDYAGDTSALDIGALVGSCRAARLEPICTCRVKAKAQGGNYVPRDRAAHEALLRRMIEARPSLVDVELVNEAGLLDSALSSCRQHGVGLVLSLHDFAATPPASEVDSLCDLLVQAVAQHPPEHDRIVFKVVFAAKKVADNAMPLRVIDNLSATRRDVVSFCMGAVGLLSRVASVIPRAAGRAHGKFTFASLVQQTAPGQVDVDTMAALLDPFF